MPIRNGTGGKKLSLVLLSYVAVAIALAPIPVIAFGLLPSYSAHSRFLVFFTPILCLLLLGYFFYIRDFVSQVMFGYLLDIWDEIDDLYPYRPKRNWHRVRTALIAVLPVGLLAGSIYCVTRYVALFDQSVTATTQAILEGISTPQTAVSDSDPSSRSQGAASITGDSVLGQRPADDSSGAAGAESAQAELQRKLTSLREHPELAQEADPLRAFVLQTARIDQIAYFGELTALYIGSFGCAIATLLLVLLKEYARDALGLRERDVLAGRILDAYEEEGEQPSPTVPETDSPPARDIAPPLLSPKLTNSPPARQARPSSHNGQPADASPATEASPAPRNGQPSVHRPRTFLT
jgi:hypothetical protein